MNIEMVSKLRNDKRLTHRRALALRRQRSLRPAAIGALPAETTGTCFHRIAVNPPAFRIQRGGSSNLAGCVETPVPGVSPSPVCGHPLARDLAPSASRARRRHARFAWLCVLFFGWLGGLGAGTALAQIVFADSTFVSADWDLAVFARPQPPTGASVSQDLGPAPRLFYQRIIHTLGGTPTPSELLSVHLLRNAVYNPKTDCPIASLSYAELSRTLATEGGTYGGATAPALLQDGLFYVADFAPTRTDPNSPLPSPFIAQSFPGLTAGSFRLVLNAGRYDNNRHPDFSRTGSPIRFGFARANSHTGQNTVTRMTAIDDWSVTVNQDIPAVADFGDAPDGSLGMGTGYYGMVPIGPFGLVFVPAPTSQVAFFPTVRTNDGPFAVLPDLYIAPLPGSPESDAIGPVDADQVFNLNPLADVADQDFFDGGGAMVLIFALAARPPALFFTLAARTPGGPQTGYWNVGIDLDQNGDWGATEWVCPDIPFDFGTNNIILLASPFFAWGTNTAFGRITFPVWARNMVTSEAVSTNTPLAGPPGRQYYAGAGPACGFTHGEIEDYFIEWFPLGPMYDRQPPSERRFGPDVPADHLAQFAGPPTITPGERVTYEISGPPLRKLAVVSLPNARSGGLAGPRLDLSASGTRTGQIQTEELVAQFEWSATGDQLAVTVLKAPRDATLVVYGEPEDRGIEGPGVPAGPNRTPAFGAVRIEVRDAARLTAIRVENEQVTLQWTGGQAPYRLEGATRPDGEWIGLLTTEAKAATLPVAGQTRFFRIAMIGQ